MQFLFFVPIIFYVTFGHDTLCFFFTGKNDLLFVYIPSGVDTITSNRISFDHIRFLPPAMACNSFFDYMTQKSILANTVIFKNEVGRAFITILIKNRASEIYFKKIHFILIIHPEIQSCITNTLESLKNALSRLSQFPVKLWVCARNIT